jgi:DNA-directed RNA polymerase subunit F
MLNRGIDEVSYNATRETVAEVKIAHGALISSFNRALRTCAKQLDIDPDTTENLVEAIRDEVGYTTEATVEEDWTPLGPDDGA